jgi:hypothetical protein
MVKIGALNLGHVKLGSHPPLAFPQTIKDKKELYMYMRFFYSMKES